MSIVPAAGALLRAVSRWERPDRLPRGLAVTGAIGPTVAGAVAGAAARYPNGPAIIDGSYQQPVSYSQLWRLAQANARELRSWGLREDSTIGLLADNGVEFVVGLVAISIVGADVVLMNTGFAAPQLSDVAAREGCDALAVAGRHTATARDAVGADTPVIEIGGGRTGRSVVPSRRAARTVILTSGTTGTPKGARRSGASPLTAAGFLERVPARSGDRVVVACPMFHAWGFTHLVLSLSLASTLIVSANTRPDDIVDLIDSHSADGLVVVPAVLQRILAAERSATARTSSLRYLASSGSAMAPSTVREAVRLFGPVLYNVYGSTEVALATIATPDDLALSASSAGRRVPGVRVKLLDDDGDEVDPGEPGRIFVDSGSAFDGYTGGGDKERHDGMVSTGDIGHFDGDQLIIDGRSDDMIVSGGENVYPSEVEQVVADLDGVIEAAVVGVPDSEFGQRLAAYVVADPKHPNPPGADSVRQAVRDRLARFKVPRDVHFIDELPRTTTGKIRRHDLT